MKSISKLKDEARQYEQREEWEKAIQVYLQVLRVGEEGEGEVELPLYNRIGDLCARLDREPEAIRYYTQAADRYAEAGLFNNAIALCNKALRYEPNQVELLKKLGQFSASQGFITDARRYFLEYAEQQFKTGKIDAARTALEDFAGVSDDGEIRAVLGQHLHALGRTDEAVHELRRAHAAFQRAGDLSQAEAVLEKLHAIDPAAARAAAAHSADEPAGSGESAEPVVDEAETEPTPLTLDPGPAGLDAGIDTDSPFTDAQAVEGFESTTYAADDDQIGSDPLELPSLETHESGLEPPPDVEVEGLEPTTLDLGLGASELRGLDLDFEIEHDETSFDEPEPLPLDIDAATAPDDEDEPEFELPVFEHDEEPEFALPDFQHDEEPSFELPLLAEDDPSDVSELPLLHYDDAADTSDSPFLFEFDEDTPADLPFIDTGTALDDDEAPHPLWLRGDAPDAAGADSVADAADVDDVAPAAGIDGVADAADADSVGDAAGAAEAAGRASESADTPRAELAAEYAEAQTEREQTEAEQTAAEQTAGEQTAGEQADSQVVPVRDESSHWTPEMSLPARPAEPAPARAAPRPARPPVQSAPPEDGYIDLGELIRDDEEQTTRFRVEERAPTGDEDRDFAELLNQFKTKVSENLPAEDAVAHYDLALAFKEMGLIDEAIAEFQIALRAGHMRLRVYEELGECFLRKDQYKIAEKVLRRALAMQFDDELDMLGVYYHLGRAYEAMGQAEQARDAYERVLGMDINFQDASARLASL
jgi:tetratricopeptide (TPR) repeat protein